MKNLFQRYSLYELNLDMERHVKNQKVNNLQMFIASEKNYKLSVTINPDKTSTDKYHGLHPRFDEEQLRGFLKDLKTNHIEEFWQSVYKIQNQENKLMNLIIPEFKTKEEIKEEYILNMIEDNKLKEELEISLLGKAILQMASHFGYHIYIENQDTYNEFKRELNSIYNINNIFYWYDDELQEVKLLGIWPLDMIKKICLDYNIIEKDSKLFLKKEKIPYISNNLYSLLNFTTEADLIFYKLLTSDVYYSGVMPCVKQIDYEMNTSLAQRVKFLIFNVVRTTFATVDAMDNSQILEHPFLEGKYRNTLIQSDYYEDILQSKYLYYYEENREKEVLSIFSDQKQYEIKLITNLNEYLKYSLNTHTIAVSTNLITNDGYLIAAKRGALNIDAGEYYCSANGQTEFRDENVNFYRKSVFEDMPTLDYFSKYRIDLNKEIERECIAELGVSSYGIDWNYYGISYLSINNNIKENDSDGIEKSRQTRYRRMHFNVLTSNTVSQSFRDIIKTHRFAIENFENESIVGIKTRVFKDVLDCFRFIGLNIYYWIDENKSKIFLLSLFILTIIGRRNYSSMDISNYLDIVLLFIYLAMSTFSWFKDKKIRRKRVLMYYYLPNYLESHRLNIEKILKSLSRKANNPRFHAIFDIMYLLHFLSLTEDSEDS